MAHTRHQIYKNRQSAVLDKDTERPSLSPDNGRQLNPTLADNNKLFSQSRTLNALNWTQFYTLYRSAVAGNPPLPTPPKSAATLRLDFDPKTTITCPSEYNEQATIAFNRAHFHRQLYDAMSYNPLSTIYSLTWSLCLHIEGRPSGYEQDNRILFDWINDPDAPYPNDAEYLLVWFPLILLHRMIKQLRRLLASPTAADNDPADLFTFEDIRAADAQFRQRFRSVIHGDTPPQQQTSSPDDIEARRTRFNTDRDAYLSSPLFARQCAGTPYGLSEINTDYAITSPESLHRLRFIPRPKNIADPQKWVYNFKRYQAYEPMRRRAEQALQAQFPNYHARHGMFLNSWLFGSVCINEAITAVQAPERSYLMYWQLHKSTLLWVLLHTLFALNDILGEMMSEDLLWFVAHVLERFIECGVCQAHWTAPGGGQFEWQQHETHFSQHPASPAAEAAGLSSPRGPITASTTTHPRLDLMLFLTHNHIQNQHINAAKGLTEAALYGLRCDYAHFASALIGCLVGDSGKPDSIPPIRLAQPYVPFRCSVYDFETARRDVCTTPAQLYTTALITSPEILSISQNDNAVMTCALALERRRIDERFTGN